MTVTFSKFRLPKLPRLPVFRLGPKSTHIAMRTEAGQYPPMPVGMVATLPEWLVYWALTKLGYLPDEDFTFQSSQLGPRYERGAAIIDFLVRKRWPPLCIRVQGEYWHYEMGTERQVRDVLQKAELEMNGLEVVDVDEDDVKRNPIYYVKQALLGIDESKSAKNLRT